MKDDDIPKCRSWYHKKLAAMRKEEMLLFCKDEAPLIDLLAWDSKVLVFHVQCKILKQRLFKFCNM